MREIGQKIRVRREVWREQIRKVVPPYVTDEQIDELMYKVEKIGEELQRKTSTGSTRT